MTQEILILSIPLRIKKGCQQYRPTKSFSSMKVAKGYFKRKYDKYEFYSIGKKDKVDIEWSVIVNGYQVGILTKINL